EDVERIAGVSDRVVHRGSAGPAATVEMPPSESMIICPAYSISPPVPDCQPPKPARVRDADGGVVSGRVLVRFVVSADGRVERVESLAPAPAPLVDAVERWLRACQFRPGTIAGRSIALKVLQTFNFRDQ